jgi:hypothetical protein
MIFTIEQAHRLCILDVTAYVNADIREVIMDSVRKQLLDKCQRRIFLLDILEILEYGHIYSMPLLNNGSKYVDLRLRVRGIEYVDYEIIHDVTVTGINEDGSIIGESSHANLFVSNDTKSYIYSVGVSMPAIIVDAVNTVRYPISQDKISVTMSTMMIPPTILPVIFIVTTDGRATDGMDREYAALVASVKEGNKDLYKLLVAMLYLYRQPVRHSSKKVSIYDIKKGVPYLYVDTFDDASHVFELDEKTLELYASVNGIVVIADTYEEILHRLHRSCVRNMSNIQGFMNKYVEPSGLTVHDKKIWNIYVTSRVDCPI